MKTVICPDSFKGSLTATEAAEAINEGVHAVCPDCDTLMLPLADGGEGTSAIIASINGATARTIQTINAIGDNITATYYTSDINGKKTALIDVAAASGLTLVSPEKRDIMNATSFGTGIMIKDALDRGFRNFIIGLGGSATCDAGAGVMKALGPDIANMASVIDVTVLCDVDNPLFGPEGAAYTFAPQKGASPQQVIALDRMLRQWNEEAVRRTGRDMAMSPGAGAAGGIGAMFMAYFNAKSLSGIEAVLDLYDFDKAVSDADIVITGEGRIDSQTLHGKACMGVLGRCGRYGVPVIALGGSVEYSDTLNGSGFTAVLPIIPSTMTLRQAMTPSTARQNLAETTKQIMKIFRSRL